MRMVSLLDQTVYRLIMPHYGCPINVTKNSYCPFDNESTADKVVKSGLRVSKCQMEGSCIKTSKKAIRAK